MANRLITQTIEEAPRVLLIGADDELSRGVAAVFEKNGIQVVSHGFAQNKISLQSKIFYKIILVNDRELPSSLFTEWCAWLSQRQEQKLLIVAASSTPVLKKDLFIDWQAEKETISSRIQQAQQLVPDMCVSVGQDVLTRDHAWLKLLHAHWDRTHQLIDPGITLFPQSISGFLITASAQWLSPWCGEKHWYKGEKTTTTHLTKVLAKAHADYFHTFPTVTTVDGGVAQARLEEGFVVKKNQDLNQVTKTMVSLAGELSKTTTQVVEKNTSENKKLPFKPPEKPIIPPARVVASRPLAKAVPRLKTVSTETPIAQEKTQHNLDQAVEKLFMQQQSIRKTQKVEQLVKTTTTQTSKLKKRSRAFFISLVLVGGGMGLLTLATLYWLSVSVLQRQLFAALSSPPEQLQTKTKWLVPLKTALQAQVDGYQLVLGSDFFNHASTLITVVNQINTLDDNLEVVRDLQIQSARNFLGAETGDSLAAAQAAASQAETTYKQMSLVQAALETVEDKTLASSQQQHLEDFLNTIKEKRKELVVVQQLQPLLPMLLAADGRKTYALLVQDSQELRPTGGFLHVVVLVTVQQGTIIDSQVFTSYELDKKFPGSVPATAEQARFLGEKNLYLRDANWDPDFPTAAAQIAWFIDKTTGKKVDGVIGLNLFVIKDLLKAIGPLEIPEHNEVITDKNLLERTEFHSEVKLVAESNQQDYLVTITQRLLGALLSLPREKTSGFLEVLSQQLKSNQLLIAVFDSGVDTSLSALGWTGRLVTPDCPTQLESQVCLVDSIAQVETNVGVNKANYDLNRAVVHTVTLGNGTARHHRQITFKNNANTTSWPQGDYQQWLRIYVNEQATAEKISLDGIVVPDNQLLVRSEHRKKMLGVSLIVPIQKQVVVDVEYEIPLPEEQAFAYALFDQKQPGTGADQETITFVFDPTLEPTLIAPQAVVNNTSVVFTQTREQNIFVGTRFN